MFNFNDLFNYTLFNEARYTNSLYYYLVLDYAKYKNITIQEAMEKAVTTSGIQEICTFIAPYFFDFDFEFWTEYDRAKDYYMKEKGFTEEQYKEWAKQEKLLFERDLLVHFWDWEIGFETYNRFKLEFLNTFIQNIRYFNQIFDSDTWLDRYVNNPLNSIELSINRRGTTKNENNGKTEEASLSTATQKAETRNNDVPINYYGNNTYDEPTNTTNSDNESTGTGASVGVSNNTGLQTDQYSEYQEGNVGARPFGADLIITRQAFISPYTIIFPYFNNLFMKLF